MYDIREGSFIKEYEVLSDLFVDHWDESAKNKELMLLKPDKAKYKYLEDQGVLFCLFAYKNEVIVGYSVNILNTHLHYSDLHFAQNDIIFVHPDYRNSPLGIKIIKETEKAVKAKGIPLMIWHAKKDSPLDAILPRLGCTHHENIYTKVL